MTNLELDLYRRWFYPEVLDGAGARLVEGATVSELRVDGGKLVECYALEDYDRLEQHGDDPAFKVPKFTAIPAGRYRIDMETVSPRYERIMPRLVGVPGFSGILIHSGNTTPDTDGCILVGRQRDERRIVHSVAAFDPLFATLQRAQKAKREIWLTIRRAPASARLVS